MFFTKEENAVAWIQRATDGVLLIDCKCAKLIVNASSDYRVECLEFESQTGPTLRVLKYN